MTYQPMDNKIIFQQHSPDGMEEVIRFDKEGFHYRDQFIADAGEAHRLMVKYLRQQTQLEPQRPTDWELLDLGNNFMGDCIPCDPDLLIAFARAVLARWGCPAIEPVLVAERLPGPKDCDGEGCCWVASEHRPAWHRVSHHFGAWHYWLPHHALPMPQQEADRG